MPAKHVSVLKSTKAEPAYLLLAGLACPTDSKMNVGGAIGKLPPGGAGMAPELFSAGPCAPDGIQATRQVPPAQVPAGAEAPQSRSARHGVPAALTKKLGPAVDALQNGLTLFVGPMGGS